MARPKSMPDFAALLDASKPISWREAPRKKPSISLAAGLIMATESPKNGYMSDMPQRRDSQGLEDWSDNLFYAYAQKSDYAQSPPYILTFANASVCDHWWSLVQREYPESARMGPQLFVLKGDDMQEQIQDNPRFHELHNKWFYTPADGSAGVIPLQDYKGHPVATPAPAPKEDEKKAGGFDMASLQAALDQMSSMISENSAQIRALSVAQSEGLQRMQEINESNMTQIKALADGQAKLQAVVSENASHYIALSNSSFSNQEQVRSVLEANTAQIKALGNGQIKMAKTCEGMMRTIENLGHTVGRVNENMNVMNAGMSDTASTSSVGSIASRISPAPRKLNRRVKGVWYEYDANPTFDGSPRKSVSFMETPPKTPVNGKLK
ncbi:hypothetical protein DM02DRAFT_522927 [Periconia macrospinosa]|uniref:Uncharacterized protein n=1 Tax=Periconia macrospinosa TaxID=97972 RepID=A0A2V1DZ23_9PLEO|nr:hypothetical protein DM02DRAFT_522927 [Periconia macrospinosa]